jgi:tRNA-Thr(GGU) m(6)t(6)A37 methyltransferase TsaA
MNMSIQITPVGKICRKNEEVYIEIDDRYGKALLGLERFSHIIVLAWFHEHDNPKDRNTLQVHPMRDRNKPLTGVFATRSPVRPNLIALYISRLRSVKNNVIRIDPIEAFDGSPVLDVKPYIPRHDAISRAQTPVWEHSRKDGEKRVPGKK